MRKEWEGFVPGRWTEQIDVEEFINLNYHPYDGDDSFLAGPTERTKECYARVQELLVEERKAGCTGFRKQYGALGTFHSNLIAADERDRFISVG